jgi:hypothetical protein
VPRDKIVPVGMSRTAKQNITFNGVGKLEHWFSGSILMNALIILVLTSNYGQKKQ